ncbi:MAG: hypothetical protein HDQ88_04280 [Clostridia bacterium]|nr:hypothetical protein [Clostridia bacterium]
MAGKVNTYASDDRVLQLADFCLDKFATKKTLTDVSNTIPVSTSDLTNNSGFITVDDLSPESLADNESLSTTLTNLINSKVTIPTKISDFENDAGFQTASEVSSAISTALADVDVPTKVSELENDSGYQTAAQVNTTIEGKGYQTAAQVEAAITAKGYLTQSEIQTLINTSIADAVTASINASY